MYKSVLKKNKQIWKKKKKKEEDKYKETKQSSQSGEDNRRTLNMKAELNRNK